MIDNRRLPVVTIAKRPRLTLDNVPDYLDWITANLHGLNDKQVEQHLRAVELVVRMQGNQAQAKATQHTLVESGIIDPPPSAS